MVDNNTNQFNDKMESVCTESPCIECKHMIKCTKMCRRRLVWGVLEADINDPDLQEYGLNIKVRHIDEIVVTDKERLKKYKEKLQTQETVLTQTDDEDKEYTKARQMTPNQFVSYYSRFK